MDTTPQETPLLKRQSRGKKAVFFAILALVNTVAVSAVSVAWFITMNKKTDLRAFSGDLNVNIDKVTAYKYVYPYYEKSTDFIDYEASPSLKGYTIEDRALEEENGLSELTFAPVTSVTLGDPIDGSYSPNSSPSNGPRSVYFAEPYDLTFCLVGNSVFTGTTSNPWSNRTATYFPSAALPTTAKNVVLAAGAEFTLFDNVRCQRRVEVDPETGESTTYYDCKYFPMNALLAQEENGDSSSNASRFQLLPGGTGVKCLVSGIYNITYSSGALSLALSDRSDEAIIGNNILDPTKIKIDWSRGGSGYGSLNAYLPAAIKEQMTMVVFDVELSFVNANPVYAGLAVRRASNRSANSIYAYPGKYEDVEHNLDGYQVVNSTVYRNPLEASDFYAYYALFTATPFASPSSMWTRMHQKTNATDEAETPLFSRFGTTQDYQSSISCRLNLKDESDSATVPSSANLVSGRKYHCYIGVDYDYLHVPFFMNENRLGKTYMLDRDFGFYFFGNQLKAQKVSSPGDVRIISVGDTLQLTSDATTPATFISDNEDVATVDEDGLITAVSVGSANILVHAEGYLDATFALTVTEP